MAVLSLRNKAPPKEFFQAFILEATSVNEVEMIAPAASTTSRPVFHQCENDTSSNEEKRENLLKEIYKEFSDKDLKYKSSLSGLNKFLKRLKSIKSSGNWERFLHTAGNCTGIRQRNGAAIRIQPTSIARRTADITRGSKRLPVERPSNDAP